MKLLQMGKEITLNLKETELKEMLFPGEVQRQDV